MWKTCGSHVVWQGSVPLPCWVGIKYLNLSAGRVYKTTGSADFLGRADSRNRTEPLIRFKLLWSMSALSCLSLSLSLSVALTRSTWEKWHVLLILSVQAICRRPWKFHTAVAPKSVRRILDVCCLKTMSQILDIFLEWKLGIVILYRA